MSLDIIPRFGYIYRLLSCFLFTCIRYQNWDLFGGNVHAEIFRIL